MLTRWVSVLLTICEGDPPIITNHDDVIKWKHFPRYWPFVRGIHRSPVNSPHKGQWRGALMFSLICAWINAWVNNREAGDLRRHRGHYDVIVMMMWRHCLIPPLPAKAYIYARTHFRDKMCIFQGRGGGEISISRKMSTFQKQKSAKFLKRVKFCMNLPVSLWVFIWSEHRPYQRSYTWMYSNLKHTLDVMKTTLCTEKCLQFDMIVLASTNRILFLTWRKKMTFCFKKGCFLNIHIDCWNIYHVYIDHVDIMFQDASFFKVVDIIMSVTFTLLRWSCSD